MKKLSDRLWQSDEVLARSLCEGERLGWKSTGLRAVLCPAYNVRIPYHKDLASLILPIWDETPVPAPLFDMAVAFHRTCGPTLVHCAGGLNRSSAFAAALLVSEGLPYEAALGAVRAVPWGKPLLRSLKEWAQKWEK